MKHGPARPQRGAALLMAMMIVALVATLATAMVWQQWRAVQVEAIERARAQSAWILSGALDWGRLILREDRNQIDYLGEIWSVPLAEARLSTFLAADKNNTDSGPEIFLSGSIVDAQARFNLRNLIRADGKREPAQVEAFKRLCELLGLPDSSARVAEAMELAYGSSTEAAAPLEPHAVDQFAWMGLDAGTLAKLAPYTVVLPATNGPTAVNVNTAPREVIAAAIGIQAALAERLVQTRQRTPFNTTEEVRKALGGDDKLDLKLVDVKTFHFEIRGRLRLDRRIIEETVIVRRDAPGGNVSAPLVRQRESLRELPG